MKYAKHAHMKEGIVQPAFSGPCERLRAFIEHRRVQGTIIGLILLNAVLLGLETWPAAMATAGGLILVLSRHFDRFRSGNLVATLRSPAFFLARSLECV